jgi:hypothetical protein
MRRQVVGVDEYERRAQLTPGLLAEVSICRCRWRGLEQVSGCIPSGVIFGAGATYLLAALVRHLVARWNRSSGE